MKKNTSSNYGSVAKFFHWLIFFLVLIMLIFGYSFDYIPKDYRWVINIHKLTGLTILSLMILRLLWMLSNPKPELPQDTSSLERVLERIIHYSLYTAIIAMPLAGWVGSMAAGKPPHLGSFNFDLPIEQNKTLADVAFTTHNTIAGIIIALISLHVLAALFHHFIRKDNVLRRMMPDVH